MCEVMRKFLHACFGHKGFWHTESGATAIEYGMIAALIVVVIIGGVQTLGENVASTLYDKLVGAF